MTEQRAVEYDRSVLSGISLVFQKLLSPPGILGFGLSVHGVLDMTEDGMIDVVVGSWGHVTLHRLYDVIVGQSLDQEHMMVTMECSIPSQTLHCDRGRGSVPLTPRPLTMMPWPVCRH